MREKHSLGRQIANDSILAEDRFVLVCLCTHYIHTEIQSTKHTHTHTHTHTPEEQRREHVTKHYYGMYMYSSVDAVVTGWHHTVVITRKWHGTLSSYDARVCLYIFCCLLCSCCYYYYYYYYYYRYGSMQKGRQPGRQAGRRNREKRSAGYVKREKERERAKQKQQ